jgi:transposase
MRNLNLEPKHNQAIREEIGERLRLLLSERPADMPPRLRELVHSFGDEKELPFRNARTPQRHPLQRLRRLKSARAWLVRRGARGE